VPRWVLRIYWRSALRSNSFLGRISLELYIRVTSSITPVWGALGYGKNKEPTPPSFLDGSRRYPSSTDRGVTLPRWIAVLPFLDGSRCYPSSRGSRRYSSRLTHAQRCEKTLVIAWYALCFLRWGGCPSSPCLATSHPTSHFIQSVTKVLLFVSWGRYRRARIDRRPRP